MPHYSVSIALMSCSVDARYHRSSNFKHSVFLLHHMQERNTHIHTYTYTLTHNTCTWHVCTRTYVRTHAHMHAHLHTSIHAHSHTYAHTETIIQMITSTFAMSGSCLICLLCPGSRDASMGLWILDRQALSSPSQYTLQSPVSGRSHTSDDPLADSVPAVQLAYRFTNVPHSDNSHLFGEKVRGVAYNKATCVSIE